MIEFQEHSAPALYTNMKWLLLFRIPRCQHLNRRTLLERWKIRLNFDTLHPTWPAKMKLAYKQAPVGSVDFQKKKRKILAFFNSIRFFWRMIHLHICKDMVLKTANLREYFYRKHQWQAAAVPWRLNYTASSTFGRSLFGQRNHSTFDTKMPGIRKPAQI